MPLYLTNAEVSQLIDMRDALDTTEEAMMLLGREGTHNEPRRRMPLPQSSLQMLAGCMPTRGVYGQRSYASARQTRTSKFNRLTLYSTRDQSFLALMDCARISLLRTGAATAVAVKYMARPDADTIGIIGTGHHAGIQLLALCTSRKIKRISAFGRDLERRKKFAADMSEKLGVPVEAASSAARCVEGAGIVVTATKSATPVLEAAWLAPGACVATMGANSKTRRELDDATVLGAKVIVVDDVAQAHLEAGEFVDLTRDGRLSWDRVVQLSDVVQGKTPGRTSAADITVFKSLGIGLEDVALGALVYERAIARNVGRMIEL